MARYTEEARIEFTADDRNFRRGIKRVKNAAREAKQDLTSLLKAFAGFAAVAGVSTKTFAEFERGLAFVSKTTGIAGASLQKFGVDIRKLSRETTFSANALLEIAQAAGQIGVHSTKDLLTYAEVVAKLGTASNLTGTEAVFALGRIASLTGLAHSEVERLASVVVDLGNNFGTTEAHIASTSQEIAAAISTYDVAAYEIAAISTAVAALGQDGAKSATAVGKTFSLMNKAVESNSATLSVWAQIMGVDVETAQAMFRESSTKAFETFIRGLSTSGSQMDLWLESIGLMDIRTNRVLKALAADKDLLSRALSMANREFEESGALQKEYETAVNTLIGRSRILWNRLVDIARVIGSKIAPTLQAMVDYFTELFSDARIEAVGNVAYHSFRIAGGFVAVKIAIIAAKFALAVFTAGFTVMRVAAAAAWGAATLGLSVLVAYSPEIYRFLAKNIPTWLGKAKVAAQIFGTSFELAWEQIKASVLGLIDGPLLEMEKRLSSVLSLLGIDTGFTLGKSIASGAAEAERNVAALEDKLHRLGVALTAPLPRSSPVLAAAETEEHRADLIMSETGGDLTGLKAPGKIKPTRATAGKAVSFGDTPEALKHKLDTQRELRKMFLDGVEEDERDHYGRMRRLELREMEARLEKDELKKQSLLARIQYERGVEVAQREEELAQEKLTRAKQRYEDERALEEARMRAETEREIRRMLLVGVEDDQISHYERMRQLKLEEWQLQDEENDARRAAEQERINRERAQEERGKKEADKRKRDQQAKQNVSDIKLLIGRSSKMAKIEAAYAKFQAIQRLLTTMPGFASQAFGQAMAALPPPFGQIVGAASAAAVMAQSALGLRAAESGPQLPSITMAKVGGVVPGSFSLSDQHLYKLRAGETVVPTEKYADVEAGIRQRFMAERENLGPSKVVVELTGDAGQFLRQRLDQDSDRAL